MNKELVLLNGKTVAVCFRHMSAKNGLNYFTSPKRSLQVAFHKYSEKKETNTHTATFKLRVITKPTEFLYIIKGSATVYLSDKNGNLVTTKRLKEDDGIILIEIVHKFVFSKNSKIIEIKQGPYE